MVGSVSGGCVESDVALQAAEVIASGEPPMLALLRDHRRRRLRRRAALRRRDRGVRRAGGRRGGATGSRHALAAGDRLAVTTVLSGAAGRAQGRTRPAQAHSSAIRTDEATFVEHYAPAPVLMIFGAVDTAQELCRIARQVGFRTMVSDARAKFATPRAAARRRRDRRRLAGGRLRAVPARRRDLRRHADPRRPLRRAGAGAGAALAGAVHRRTGQPPRAAEPPAPAARTPGYTEDEIDRISGPLGLDIGATTPAETAVSVMAEVLAVRSRAARAAGSPTAAAASTPSRFPAERRIPRPRGIDTPATSRYMTYAATPRDALPARAGPGRLGIIHRPRRRSAGLHRLDHGPPLPAERRLHLPGRRSQLRPPRWCGRRRRRRSRPR